jgi:phenylacetate-CoA ligase
MTSLAEELAEQQRWRPLPRFANVPWFRNMILREFFPPEVQKTLHGAALHEIATFAAAKCPYYERLFDKLNLRPGDLKSTDALPRLPVLSRSDVVAHFEALQAVELPAGETLFGTMYSSGTTGVPVRVPMTREGNRWYTILWQRQARWFRMDPLGTLLDVRVTREMSRATNGGGPQPDGEASRHASWRYLGQIFETGPEINVNNSTPADRQVELLRALRPHYLHTYPGTFEEAAMACEGRSPVDSLRGCIALGAQLTPALREKLEQIYNVPIDQIYGLNEIGKVAVRCQAGRYHVHAEHCVVETVDESGQPCRPGETGRIVVTALRNFAFPLLRYDTGDLAEAVDAPCPCGRTLPSFTEIAGRYRRFHGLPPGTRKRVSRFCEGVSRLAPSDVTFLRAYQLFQDREDRFSLRVRVSEPVPVAFSRAIAEIWAPVADGRPLDIVVMEDIPRSPSGKHLDFLSEFHNDDYVRPATAVGPQPTVVGTTAEFRTRHWGSMAAARPALGPPLRPHAQDVEWFQTKLDACARASGALRRIAMLGVTPELAALRKPRDAELAAFDRSSDMLAQVWPGDTPWRRGVCGDWVALLAGSAPCEAILGDCSLTTQLFPQEWGRLASAVRTALRDEGVLLLRCRVLPAAAETPENVFAALAGGNIGSFHAFKLRLAMALQTQPGAAVAMSSVWDRWSIAGIDPCELSRQTSWSEESIATMDLYRDKPARLTFPTLAQVRDVFEPHFQIESISVPEYELGACHPRICFRCR